MFAGDSLYFGQILCLLYMVVHAVSCQDLEISYYPSVQIRDGDASPTMVLNIFVDLLDIAADRLHVREHAK